MDDPELDPIWDAAARLNIPVLIHTAEPQEFFRADRLSRTSDGSSSRCIRSTLSAAGFRFES
jgi:predicted TIM-barrel fold metal-dependent hydrolase